MGWRCVDALYFCSAFSWRFFQWGKPYRKRTLTFHCPVDAGGDFGAPMEERIGDSWAMHSRRDVPGRIWNGNRKWNTEIPLQLKWPHILSSVFHSLWYFCMLFSIPINSSSSEKGPTSYWLWKTRKIPACAEDRVSPWHFFRPHMQALRHKKIPLWNGILPSSASKRELWKHLNLKRYLNYLKKHKQFILAECYRLSATVCVQHDLFCCFYKWLYVCFF